MPKYFFSETKLVFQETPPVPNIMQMRNLEGQKRPSEVPKVKLATNTKTPESVNKQNLEPVYKQFLEKNRIPPEKQKEAINKLKSSLTVLKTIGPIFKRAKDLMKAEIEDTGSEAAGETKLNSYLQIINFKDKFSLFTGALAYIDQNRGTVEGGPAIKVDIEGVQLTYMRGQNNTNSYFLNFEPVKGMSTQIRFDQSGRTYNANIYTSYSFSEQFAAGGMVNVGGNMRKYNLKNSATEGTAFCNYKVGPVNFGIELTYGSDQGKRKSQCIFKVSINFN